MGEPRMTVQTLAVLRVMLDDPDAPRYGLELSREADLRSGTLYPVLARLEQAGWLESRWEEVDPSEAGRPRRRLYTLTAAGEREAHAALAEQLERLAPGGARGVLHGPSPAGGEA